MTRERDFIVGGDTPFVQASDGPRAFGADHRPLKMEVDGKEATRAMHLTMCALQRQMLVSGEIKLHPDDPPIDEFMRQFIAGANHDLRLVGLPMLSIAEVNRYSELPEIIAACKAKPEGQPRG
jgi:hypothetical protein